MCCARAPGKNIEPLRQENEAIFAEIENIGKSYEGMQAQNTRLMQQLGEKDDATTKIIAEVGMIHYYSR